MTSPSELVGDVDVCPHCRGTGQPHGIMGGPEHGLCSWCKGTGQKFSSPRNPSETRDSELVAKLRSEAENARVGFDAGAEESIIPLLKRAADTIDRLTSSGEAVAYRWMNAAGQLVYTSWKPTAAEALRRSVTPLYTYASPPQGHVTVPVEPREPDYCYLANDWEATYPWAERDTMMDDVPRSEIERVETLFKGPTKWLASVPVRWHEGEPEDWELRVFDTEDEAKAAALPHNQGETKP